MLQVDGSESRETTPTRRRLRSPRLIALGSNLFFFAINLPGDLFSRNSILKGKKRHSARSWTRREMRLAPSCCSSPCHLANRTFLSCSQLPLSAFCGGEREALRGISPLFLHFDAANVRGSEGDREIRNQATSAETRLASPVGRKGTFD